MHELFLACFAKAALSPLSHEQSVKGIVVPMILSPFGMKNFTTHRDYSSIMVSTHLTIHLFETDFSVTAVTGSKYVCELYEARVHHISCSIWRVPIRLFFDLKRQDRYWLLRIVPPNRVKLEKGDVPRIEVVPLVEQCPSVLIFMGSNDEDPEATRQNRRTGFSRLAQLRIGIIGHNLSGI
jgi:hypothetical protein